VGAAGEESAECQAGGETALAGGRGAVAARNAQGDRAAVGAGVEGGKELDPGKGISCP